jgi:uncharacterized coiled-coil protein SlyX
MQPLNQADRKKAFTNFMIFFVVTIALILITGFYSVQVPFKDNERLREINEIAENEKAFADKFQAKLAEALQALEAVNQENFAEQAESYDSRIQETISQMSTMIGNDSISNKNFYRSVLSALTASRLAKKELREIKSRNADAGEWKDKFDRLNQDFKDYQNQVQNEALRRSQQPARN